MISKKEQLEAGYRVQMKRILRNAIGYVDNETPTEHLEKQVMALALSAPAVVARGLDRTFTDAARAWEKGTNSGNQAGMDEGNAECERLRDRAERVLALFDVKIDYPGLYPCFNWQGHDYHSTESLLQWIARETGKVTDEN